MLKFDASIFGGELAIGICTKRRGDGWCHIVPSPACSRSRVYPIYRPTSDISDFGWRGREGARTVSREVQIPLPRKRGRGQTELVARADSILPKSARAWRLSSS